MQGGLIMENSKQKAPGKVWPKDFITTYERSADKEETEELIEEAIIEDETQPEEIPQEEVGEEELDPSSEQFTAQGSGATEHYSPIIKVNPTRVEAKIINIK